MGGDHFIPVREADVVSMCAAELPPAESEAFLNFARVLARLQHQQFYERIEVVKDAWSVLKPQTDSSSPVRVTSEERSAARQCLEDELVGLARAAKFVGVEEGVLDRAFRDHALLKVRMVVDPEAIEKLMLYRRDESVRTEQIRSWFGLRRRPVTFTSYAMVLVYAVFKDDHRTGAGRHRTRFRPGSTTLKLFQNVPREDLEMVLPNVHVQMRLVDKLFIGVPAVISGGIVIATKLVASLSLLLLLLAFWIGIRHEPVTLSQTALVSAGAGLVAAGAYFVRQVTKFKNRKILFMKALSDNLYFRNLDNDAGVFHHLLDAAEEAETTETVLAYHLLRTAGHPLPAEALDRRVEKWFAERWNATVDFDIEDAVRKLRQLSLVTEDDDARFKAIGLAEARLALDRLWVGLVRDERTADSAVVAGVGMP
jgi:uncharacterized protein DUF3754